MSSDSLRQRLYFAWTLARGKPLRFLLAGGYRLLQPLQRRLRQVSTKRAEQVFAARYPREAASGESWRRALGCILPAVCLERENYLRLWADTRPVHTDGARPQVLAAAEKVCRHRFNLLGSGEVELGAEIDWHRDFKSGRRWPCAPSHRLPLLYPEDASDIKVPWELSRFQHLPLLGKAYWLTGEERFAQEFARQLEDWMAKNPLGYGPNWMLAMEAAIRAINWLYAANFFVGSPALSDEFWYGLRKALFLHGCFIRANLEWNPYARGNHYLADLVGLSYLGAFFADSRPGRDWLGFATRELGAELDHQVRRDGVAHEASLAYHHLVTELLLAGSIIVARNAESSGGEVSARRLEALFGPARVHKLQAMLEFILHYTRPDGRAPLVGDSDDGRLFQLAGYGSLGDHRHLLATAALLFEREDFRQALDENGTEPAAGPEGWEEAWWLLGAAPPTRAPDSGKPAAGAGPGSRAFSAGGFFVLRDPKAYVLLRCGDVGLEGVGAHAHCDQLSFELALGRQPLIIDPGSYLYTADLAERYRFRSTASHNTVRVARAEQNWIGLRDCFRMPDDTHARVRHWRCGAAMDEFEGEHFGYEQLPGRVVHRRACTLDKADDTFYVLDLLLGHGQLPLEWFFHLAPGVTPARRSLSPRPGLRRLKELKPEHSALASTWVLKTAAGSEVPLSVLSPVPLEAGVGAGWASPRYGVREKISVLSFRAQAKLPVSVLFVFDLAQRY